METRRKGKKNGCDTLCVGLKLFLTTDPLVFFNIFCWGGGGVLIVNPYELRIRILIFIILLLMKT